MKTMSILANYEILVEISGNKLNLITLILEVKKKS